MPAARPNAAMSAVAVLVCVPTVLVLPVAGIAHCAEGNAEFRSVALLSVDTSTCWKRSAHPQQQSSELVLGVFESDIGTMQGRSQTFIPGGAKR